MGCYDLQLTEQTHDSDPADLCTDDCIPWCCLTSELRLSLLSI